MVNLNSTEIDVLRSLLQANVRFVVVGGRAANFHKILRAAPDLDLFYSGVGDNLSQLLKCLKQYGGDNLTLDSLSVAIQINSLGGPIQLHSKIDAVSFDEAYSNAVFVNVENVRIPFISTTHFLQNKRQSGLKVGRQKDLNDVDSLEKILSKG